MPTTTDLDMGNSRCYGRSHDGDNTPVVQYVAANRDATGQNRDATGARSMMLRASSSAPVQQILQGVLAAFCVKKIVFY